MSKYYKTNIGKSSSHSYQKRKQHLRTLSSAPTQPPDHTSEPAMALWILALTALVVGLGTGLIAVAFRYLLTKTDQLRTHLLNSLGTYSNWAVIIAIIVPALLAAGAAAIVHFWEPIAEGSGIPRVEAIVKGKADPSSMHLLPIKFGGGLMAIGGGLALGREGPSVHMGGAVAVIVNKFFHRNPADLRLLIAAGAAAGLTTAFSAPLAGAVFVLEELVKKFEARMTIAVLTASFTACIVVHLTLGDGLNFPLPTVSAPHLKHAPIIIIIGLLAGVFGVLYNSALISTLRFVDKSRVPVALRAAIIGGTIGLVGWCVPTMIGGGDDLTYQALLGQGTILTALAIFTLRFVLAIGSYAALTPGGLFAPMLVLGAEIGLFVGLACNSLFPFLHLSPGALAILGMAAFFASSVRAPVTGLVLATEMTGAVGLLPALLGACGAAMLVAELCKSTPIYDALAERSAKGFKANKTAKQLAS